MAGRRSRGLGVSEEAHSGEGAHDPWAPPEHKVPLDKPQAGPPPYHGQSVPPPGGFPVPPPPIAPTGPGAVPYDASGYYAGYGWPGMPMQPRNGFGIAALVLGILSVCLFCAYGVVSVVLGILAVVFGVKGRKRADQGEADNYGQAQAGFVLGIIGLALGVAVITLMIIGFLFAFTYFPTDPDSSYVDDALRTSVTMLLRR
ncbi:DUF4190 domain-containing protein [Streptomyces sp. NPDC052051]|uniref:DUF4190 domain-containing protein n=1 Tax=Streptomyces sp. NPDC052051 TaxID=3154649 RepID=UPI00341DEC58